MIGNVTELINTFNAGDTANEKVCKDLETSKYSAEEVKIFDFDGNGKIDSDREVAAYNDYSAARDEAKLEAKFDINGDGKIDDTERTAYFLYQSLQPRKDGAKFGIDASVRDIMDMSKRENEKIKSKRIDN
ncbi:MAG: hypothetical protein MJ180_01140 [Candidatus Gastranaerophilales bacterium]|nr:hypothetical protein [Candidatus Gastranaerophilales bacterium]